MAETTPYVQVIESQVPAVGAGADAETNVGVAALAGTVTAVSYVPVSTLTGANTDSRTLVLVNKGAAGAGTTAAATRAYTAGVNASADRANTITLSGTAANLVVAAGDVLALQSNHVGATGLADPGGLVHVELTRS